MPTIIGTCTTRRRSLVSCRRAATGNHRSIKRRHSVIAVVGGFINPFLSPRAIRLYIIHIIHSFSQAYTYKTQLYSWRKSLRVVFRAQYILFYLRTKVHKCPIIAMYRVDDYIGIRKTPTSRVT